MKETTRGLIVAGMLLSGCATMPLDHPDPKVSVPAEIGGIAGIILGIPLDIVALPITGPMAAMDKSPDGGGAYTIMAPSLGVGYVLGNAVGFIPWLVWGWWGNEKYEKQQGYLRSSDYQKASNTLDVVRQPTGGAQTPSR